MGYVALVAAFILIAVALNGGLGQSVSRRIEYPELLTAIREDNVKAVAIRGTSLVGLYRNGTVSDADFPERGYDFETTIGSDFIDTVRQMTATAQGKSLDEVSVSDLPFTVEYRAPVVTPWYMEFLPFILMIVITMAAWYFIMARQGGGNSKVMNFGKSRARMSDPSKNPITFKDVAGAKEEKEELQEMVDFLKNPKAYTEPVDESAYFLSLILSYVLPLLLMVGLMMFLFRGIGGKGGMGGLGGVGKANAKVYVEKKTGVTFRDVAGQDEAKESLQEIIDILHNPQKYTEIGAKLPKGALLVGPPGTGKTLLAKAVAGEAGVPFFSISGSDFVEMFVGVGASRVRDLFDQAKKAAPSIVFIDEIDAVGRHRGAGLGGGHDEREQTLNQLLVEMDGFTMNEGVIVMAATNRRDILDPALLRPGRFDRQVTVNYPDLEGRVDILKVHSRGKALDKDVDLENIAKRMPYSSGADLENVMNEGAILAVRRKKKKISQQDLVDAVSRVQMGPEKRSHKVTPRDRKTTAYHEAGHAVIANLLPECDDVHLVTIVPRGQAGGYTLSLPSEENDNYSRTALLGMVTMALGGHAAEHVSLDDIYTGASSDIKRATELCRRMVTQFGMSDSIGTMYLGSDQEVFVGMEFGQSREYSEQSAAAIDQEVKRLLDECYARACKLLKDHMDKLVAVAEALLERDTLTRADFECVMRGEPLPPMTDVEKMQPSSEAQADPTPDAQTDGAVTPGFATQDAQEDGDPFVEPKDGE